MIWRTVAELPASCADEGAQKENSLEAKTKKKWGKVPKNEVFFDLTPLGSRSLTSGHDGLVRVVDGVVDAQDAAQGVQLVRGLLHRVQVGYGQVRHLARDTHPLVLAVKVAVEVVSPHSTPRQEAERQGSHCREGGGCTLDTTGEHHFVSSSVIAWGRSLRVLFCEKKKKGPEFCVLLKKPKVFFRYDSLEL